MTRIINKQFSVVPTTAGVANLTIGLGWITPDQGSNFNPAGSVVQRRYTVSSWTENPATITGSGSVAIPYYAVVSGITNFGTFIVANATATALPLNLVSIAAIQKDNNNLVT